MALLICRPVDTTELVRRAPNVPVPDPHKGSVIGHCQGCGQEVWEGPEQHALASQYTEEAGGHVVICILCGIAFIHELEAKGQTARIDSLTDNRVPMRYPDGTVVWEFPASFLRCVWGKNVAFTEGTPHCEAAAVRDIMLHDGPNEAVFRLCEEHANLVIENTNPHAE